MKKKMMITGALLAGTIGVAVCLTGCGTETGSTNKPAVESGNVMAESIDLSSITNENDEGFESKNSITSITFLNSLSDMPEESSAAYIGDISQSGDGTVMAWVIEDVASETEKSEDDTEREDIDLEDADADEITYALYIAGDGGVDAGENGKSLFSSYTNVRTIEFNHCFYTGNVTDMSHMFGSCENLTELDLSSFDTSEVKNMSGMFGYCYKLEELDVSNFDTSKVTDMSYMFRECSELTQVDVSGFDTSKVKDMSKMFYYCSSLVSLDVSNWNTSKVENMETMFTNCSSLTTLDISNWNVSELFIAVDIFKGCDNLDLDEDDLW